MVMKQLPKTDTTNIDIAMSKAQAAKNREKFWGY